MKHPAMCMLKGQKKLKKLKKLFKKVLTSLSQKGILTLLFTSRKARTITTK